MTCAFCKTSYYGCTPGRCFGPRSKRDDEKVAPPTKPLAPQLGPKRLVLSSHRRSGAGGGDIWVLELECGHVVWRKGIKKPPKESACMACGESAAPFNAACGCGCGDVADANERARDWFWRRGAWFKCAHVLKALRVS